MAILCLDRARCGGWRRYVVLMMRVTSSPNIPFVVTTAMHPLKKCLSYPAMAWEESGLEMRWTPCSLKIQFCLSLWVKYFKLETLCFITQKDKNSDCLDNGRSLWSRVLQAYHKAPSQLITVKLLKEHLEHSKHQLDGHCHCHHQQVHCQHCHQKLTAALWSILVGLVFCNTWGHNSTRLKWLHGPQTQACSYGSLHTLCWRDFYMKIEKWSRMLMGISPNLIPIWYMWHWEEIS